VILSYLWDWAKKSWRNKERVERWGIALIFTIGLLALADVLPPFPTESSKLIGSLLVTLAIWRFLANSLRLTSAALWSGLSWLILWGSSPQSSILMASFVSSVLAWLVKSEFLLWAITASGWSIIAFAFRNNPYLWHGLDHFSSSVSRYFNEHLFLSFGFSPIAIGWDASLLGLLLAVLSGFINRLSWWGWLIRAILFSAWWLFCQLLFSVLVTMMTFFGSWKGLNVPLNAVTLHSILACLLLAVPCWWSVEKQNFQPLTLQKQKWFLAVVGCWLAFAFALSFSVPMPPKPMNPKVTILEPLLGDWNSPSDGKYGVQGWGMYGMLTRYLKAIGCRKVYRTKKVADEILSQTDVLMIFTPMRMPTAEEVQKLERFVKGGGGLAVFSDHTDLEGIMPRLNRWLKPFNASIPFDSAMYLYRDELPCFELRPHPVTVGLDASEIRIAIGSSVNIRPPLKPIILFRLGFSDIGNYQNKERAFMGNEAYDLNERIGDIVLVATGHFGKGKVAIFGDTTAFQNSLLPESWRFIARLINWLASRHDPLPLRLLESKLGIILVLISLLCLFLLSSSPKTLVLATLAGLIFHYGTGLMSERIQQGQWQNVPEAVAIDLCHANDVSVARISGKGTDGLTINLMRRGFLPFLTRENETVRPLQKLPNRLVLIEPLKPMKKETTSELIQWLHSGGKMMVFVSPEGWENAKNLLQPLGLFVEPVPLGPGRAEKVSGQLPIPYLSNAWALKLLSDGHKPLASKYGFPIVVVASVGRGKLILFSDPQWALNRSLESFYQHNEANVQFFKALLQRFW